MKKLTTPRLNKYIPITPTPKQTAFLLMNDIREVFYGGAAGGGKSVALLAAALQYVDVPGYAALILRRTYTDLALPGALMDIAEQWLRSTDATFSSQTRTWTFPSGATLTFGYLETEKDKFRYQGAQFHFIAFDELTQFEETQYRYLFSRLRRPGALPVPMRMRSASNPGGVGHEWVRQRFLEEKNSERIFIPAGLDDNPHLDREQYRAALDLLDPITRAQLLNGNWDVRPSGGLFQRSWFDIVGDVPKDAAVRVRYWDMAATLDGDWTVGCKLVEKGGQYWVEDLIRIRQTPLVVQETVRKTAEMDGKSCYVYMEQEPGSSGVALIDHYARNILQGYIFRADKKTGDKIARAMPVSSAAEHGNIKLMRGSYLVKFLDEIEAFPETVHDDQVDALSGAFEAISKIKKTGIRQIGSLNNDINSPTGISMSAASYARNKTWNPMM